jgi:pyruvate formate lyase activating enzyme
MPYVAVKNSDRCKNCGFCDEYVACSSKYVGYSKECVGCCACYISCPNKAIEIRERAIEKKVQIEINEKRFSLPERITVKQALEITGYKVSKFPSDSDMFAPCEVGGCFSCSVEVDGTIRPSCITGIREGMNIKTFTPDNYIPRRIVHGWMGHAVGGVGTPWRLKGNGAIEVACFTAGCNLRCPQCQNWTTTYCGKGEPLAPKDAAMRITEARKRYRVNRMAISGGESTLNRSWLLQYLKESKRLNPDTEARLHVDTNATILTMDYIDELVEAGMTDIGPDLKGLYPETFMRITGIEDKDLAERYQKTSWEAVEYIINKYRDKVFIGIGIPYNETLISIQEIADMGKNIVKIDPTVQVSVLDYRSEFRAMNISRPSLSEMVLVWKALKETGLRVVLCQTGFGYIGPEIDNVP